MMIHKITPYIDAIKGWNDCTLNGPTNQNLKKVPKVVNKKTLIYNFGD